MPLPLAHSAAGLATYLVFKDAVVASMSQSKRTALVLLVVISANMPDLDFLPGIIIGKPNQFHHGISHSLFAAVIIAGFLVLLTRKYFERIPANRLFLICATAVMSHVFFDYLSMDFSFPHGVPLFWPISNEYYMSSVPVFLNVRRSGESTFIFFTTLLNWHNLVTLIVELFFSISLIAAALANKYAVKSKPFLKSLTVAVIGASLFLLARLLLT